MADRRVARLIRETKLLDKHFPHGRATGELQPSEISNLYFVDLRYAPPKHPRVVVHQPDLVADLDGHLPHIYQDGSLCLFKPGQWTHGDPIATTILPWTCEWLLHYEFWRATGEWCGSGGDHVGPVDRRPKHRKSGARQTCRNVS